MKTLDSIPITKMERAGKLVQTGVKLGGNYVKYYGKKIIKGEADRESLDQENAKDVYDGLKTLKGSALKVAQMLSMEQNLLPRAYVEQFSLAQFSVPALSGPLVNKTFRKYFAKDPNEIFDSFESEAVHAASIGQVHRATKDGLKLAVKIQYPGVANSVQSDLALVRPIAMRMLQLKGRDLDKYFREVESKLLEETDYVLELNQGQEIAEACKHIKGIRFPKYYSQWSSDRILTMDWMEGMHLGEFVKSDFDTQQGSAIGQVLWDFYMFQIHELKRVHADPHPGNFLVDENGELVAIDFGCVKQIPDTFYTPYFELASPDILANEDLFVEKLLQLEILQDSDTPKEREFYSALFLELLSLFTRPFHADEFDFSDTGFWSQITELSKRFASDPNLRKMDAGRGSPHFLYMNRTFFGLYHLLYDLKARVKIKSNYLQMV
jgi:predicted unusual protein kinase regulating ubiquinone biosynthesis (AarF/ABC1/UbiB family)